nr:GNAT family N-acetyltransferase [Clostridium sp. KNHs214]
MGKVNIIIKKITKENYKDVLALHVAKEQEGFIESTKECLDEAKESDLWRPVGIYNENQLVGFSMYGLFKDKKDRGRVWLDRFMIAKEYQGKGYGNKSLDILIDRLFNEYNCGEIYLSVYGDNVQAIKMYKCRGFKFNGEIDINGEKVMVLKKETDSKVSNYKN